MPPLIPLLLFALCLYPALLLSVVIHEAGHALSARLTGHRVTSFGLGTGRLLFRTTFPGGVIFFVCRSTPTLGTCWTTATELLPSRFQRIALLLGGGVTNLIAAALFAVLLTGFRPGVLWLALAVMNALVGLANLLPFRRRVVGSMHTVASDGLQAASLFLSRHARAEPPRAELGFQALWEEIGDTHTHRYRLFRAGLAALEADNLEEAARYRAEAEVLPGGESAAHLTYLHGRIALQSGDLPLARIALRAARHWYTSHRDEGSVLLCRLYALFAEDQPEMAEIEALGRLPLAQRADVAAKIAATRLLLFVLDADSDADTAALETLLARYESARRRFRSDTDDARVYAAVARWRQGQGDAAGARIAREEAERAMREIASALSAAPVPSGTPRHRNMPPDASIR